MYLTTSELHLTGPNTFGEPVSVRVDRNQLSVEQINYIWKSPITNTGTFKLICTRNCTEFSRKFLITKDFSPKQKTFKKKMSRKMSVTAQGNEPNKWTTLTPLQTTWPRRNSVCIGNSIWNSTDYNDGNGIIEVDCGSNTIKQTVEYPKGFSPENHSVCGSDEDGIVIVDGYNGKLIAFNPKNKKYGAAVSIPKFGVGTSAIIINGNVHIIHGHKNSKNRYLICSVKTGKVKEWKDDFESPEMRDVSITRTDNGQFIKFGGCDCDKMEGVDTLYVGTVHDEEWINSNIYVPLKSALDELAANTDCEYDTGIIGVIVDYVHGDAQEQITWKESPELKLKTPVMGCGVITKGPFVVMFGRGSNFHFGHSVKERMDSEPDKVPDEESICRGAGPPKESAPFYVPQQQQAASHCRTSCRNWQHLQWHRECVQINKSDDATGTCNIL